MKQRAAQLLTKAKAPPGRGLRGSNMLQRCDAGAHLILAPAPGAPKAIRSQRSATLEEVSQDRHFHAKCFCSYQNKKPKPTQEFNSSQHLKPRPRRWRSVARLLLSLPSLSTQPPQQCFFPDQPSSFRGNRPRERCKRGGRASTARCWDTRHPAPMPPEQGVTSTSRRPSSSSPGAAARALLRRAGQGTEPAPLLPPGAHGMAGQAAGLGGLGISATACLIPSDPRHFGRTKSRVSFASKSNLRFQGLEALQSRRRPGQQQ